MLVSIVCAIGHRFMTTYHKMRKADTHSAIMTDHIATASICIRRLGGICAGTNLEGTMS